MNARLVMATAGLASAAVVGLGQQSWADPAPLVGQHRHFIVTPDGSRVAVGPDACGTAWGSSLHRAFSQFHANIHAGQANDAFDHAHNPVDIAGGRC